MVKVVAVTRGPTRVAPRHDAPFAVRRDYSGVAIHGLLLLNLLAMPMKAYVSEAFPWAPVADAPPSFPNYSAFNTSTLALDMALYTPATSLPEGATYVIDAKRNTHVFRHVIHRSTPLRSLAECDDTFLVGIPGMFFAGPVIHKLLCDCAMAPNMTALHGRGSCLYLTMTSLMHGHVCVWIVADAPNESIVFYAYTPRVLPSAFLWFKFAYLLPVPLTLLRRHGHQRQRLSPHTWRYTIVWGDPSVLVLANPYICIGFLIDAWLSADMAGLAVLRLYQTSDRWLLLRSSLYLSRVVWAAYAALCATNAALKRWKREHLFSPLDPTVAVILVTVFCVSISWLSQNVGVFLKTMRYLYELAGSTGESTDIFVGCSAFTLAIPLVPLGHGFLRSLAATNSVGPSSYSSFRYKNLKNRVWSRMTRCWQRRPEPRVALGGTMHALRPRFKTCVTMDWHATDCFVLCYCNDVLDTTLRVGLLNALDRRESDPEGSITTSCAPSEYGVFQLRCLPIPGTHSLSAPATPSAWCL
ncbi:hypothetical protein SDRG_03872 [Saprolegnia diclina VS20]|uniref:Uncharacterized protein n=1 Tax=Saprolegnia diclina (strain VS20) TaxID=1156394 RepID=T0QLH1_SAPDV|nr:hypothetical protein SDRG_03872 [Saprolegnia diclina VS20]EQC38914.1 hypothetical protein SDRG_03872 [Saprolegnia diclina VS20]|eukprot:XP_008607738.1 hypothetical protein SDRG_03872 [Saprolegnia diclina VS20]